MADVKDLFFHGIRQQIRRVLEAMGEKRITDGITAFETGASNWSACFFARAYPELNLNFGDPEAKIAEALGMPGNKVPMRIVYRTFDGVNITMTQKGLLEFCQGFLDEKRDPEVQKVIDDVLKNVDYSGVEDKPVDMAACSIKSAPPAWASRAWDGDQA